MERREWEEVRNWEGFKPQELLTPRTLFLFISHSHGDKQPWRTVYSAAECQKFKGLPTNHRAITSFTPTITLHSWSGQPHTRSKWGEAQLKSELLQGAGEQRCRAGRDRQEQAGLPASQMLPRASAKSGQASERWPRRGAPVRRDAGRKDGLQRLAVGWGGRGTQKQR